MTETQNYSDFNICTLLLVFINVINYAIQKLAVCFKFCTFLTIFGFEHNVH